MSKQKVSDAALRLQNAIVKYRGRSAAWHVLAESLNEFIATVLAEWPEDRLTIIARYRDQFRTGLGGCTRGDVPLTSLQTNETKLGRVSTLEGSNTRLQASNAVLK